jgi:hypothetical protein
MPQICELGSKTRLTPKRVFPLAKAFVERMPLHSHTAILDTVVIAGGARGFFRDANRCSGDFNLTATG